MIKVFIADDHAVVRRGLQLMIEATDDMVVVGSAADGAAALHAPEIDACDVLLLDLSLPRVSGAEVLRRLRARRAAFPIVILSMYPEDQYALQLLREGASAYLSKDRPPEELLAALRKAAAGGTYVTDTLAEHALRGDAPGPPHTRLSPREQHVFRLIVEGRSVSEIAAELDLSMSTVSNHLRHVKDKLSVNTIAEVIGYAHRAGLSGPADRR
ncbi:MAG: response regulator transcription factor [Minicystis sp.]